MASTKSGRVIKLKTIFSPIVPLPKHKSIKKKSPVRKRRVVRKSANVSQHDIAEKKVRYLEEAKLFNQTLAINFNIQAVQDLYCPTFTSKPCECLQKFLSNEDDAVVKERIENLINLRNQAEDLRKLKYYNLPECNDNNSILSKGIGLGNGHKKNQKYVDFVLCNRKYLKENLKLCEKAVQKILCYSNTFLHRRLKTEPGNSSRVVKNKSLISIEELAEFFCCLKKCVKLAKSHPNLLLNWRDRAGQDQAEARRVIAEMLTPCQGNVQNCFQFIAVVTGCSTGTITKVSRHMEETGGNKEPPEHGLKKWWREHVKSNEKSANYSHKLSASEKHSSTITETIPLPPKSVISIDNSGSYLFPIQPVEKLAVGNSEQKSFQFISFSQ